MEKKKFLKPEFRRMPCTD